MNYNRFIFFIFLVKFFFGSDKLFRFTTFLKENYERNYY